VLALADYDLLVIGAGSGGVRAARVAANHGAKTAIIEEYRVGGTCVIRGCVPKKLFVYASRFNDLFDIAGSFGWQVNASFDWPALVANKDRGIDRLEMAYVAGLEKPGVEIIRDRAELAGPNAIRLVNGGTTLTAKTILVATGGRPWVPQIPGRELGITSNEAFHLERLPASILIEGGGYIAVEFATIFAGLGVETTIVYRGDGVLRGFDEDVRQLLDAGLETRGIRRIYQTNLTALRQSGDGVIASFSDGVEAPFGAVMFATRRAAKGAGLGPEAAGFADSVFGGRPTEVDLSLLGTAVFSEPEVATIGLTETEALTHGDIDVYIARFRPMLETLTTRTGRMMLKLITAAEGGRVLGVHVVGAGAAEMIQMAAIALGMGATKADFDRTIAMHPTAAEELVTFKAPSYRWRGGEKL